MKTHTMFNLVIVSILVFSLVGVPAPVLAEQLQSEPTISVHPDKDRVTCFNWPLGALLVLEIDDPGSPQAPDYETSHVVLGPNNYEQIELSGIFDIQPGYLVTVSDGNVTRQHTVTRLAVTNTDIDLDTVSGIATPYSNIRVETNCDANGCAYRNVIADENGNWLANFSILVSDPAQGDGLFDIRLASGGGASEYEGDGDGTSVSWIVWPPTIGVDVDIDRVQGWDWTLGATVNFEIDDPSTPDHPDYSYTAIAHASDWDPNLVQFEFHTENYDLKPGDIVTATDGNITKQLLVTDYRITHADLFLDIVYGVADPGQKVHIWTQDQNNTTISRYVTVDEDGNWSANFAIPGDEASELGTLDIRNGMSFDSMVGDEDWDNTRCLWDTPNPRIGVSAKDDYVNGWGWILGSTVTVTVDDPGTAADPDITRTAVLYEAPWNPEEIRFDLDLSGVIDIQTGFEVTASDDDHNSKTLVVQSFGFSDIDLNLDTVTGFAPPNSIVYIWTCWQSDPCVNRDETADQDGNWVTNFAVPGEQDWEQETADLRPGSWIDSGVDDEDGDTTMYGWYVPNLPEPKADIDIYSNHIFASNWIVGSDVTVSFDIPGSAEEWDYSKTVTVPDGWGAWCQFQIDIDPAEFRIASGQVVRITDGTTTRQATIPDFSVTSEDPTADTVSGTAPAGSIVNLFTSSGGSTYQRNPIADSEGQWFADFAHPGTGSDEQGTFDVIPGDGRLFGFFWISQPIDDFIGIKFMWDFGPYFHVFPEDERIETYVWPIGANLTLTIDNPATPQNPDVTRTQENLEWQTNFEALGTIRPGFVVSITDGLVTKTHIVTALTVTGADSNADTIVGMAAPGSQIDVDACDDNGCAYRLVSAGDNRLWLADFSVPGDMGSEQNLFDILPGSTGPVSQADMDGDTTALRWHASEQSAFAPFVVFGQEGVWLKENTEVISGDVAANLASERPYLTDGSEVTIGQDVRFLDPASRVLGDSVYLRRGAEVYDVYYNELLGLGDILGDSHTPLDLPLVSQFPDVPQVTPGTQNFNVPIRGTLTLAAGNYGKLEAKRGATITFTGGIYNFTQWNLADNVKVYFTAPTEIHIAGKLDIGAYAYVGPASSSDMNAHDILIYVLGVNGYNGRIGADPKAAKFGIRNTIVANIYAPNGTLWIREQSTATGAFFGRWVEIGQNVTLDLDNGWR